MDILLGFIGIAFLLWVGILLTRKAWLSTDFDKKHLQGGGVSDTYDLAIAAMTQPPSNPPAPELLTLHICGPTACEHDYSGYQDIVIDGKVRGGTAVCSKCGCTAFDEAGWL